VVFSCHKTPQTCSSGSGTTVDGHPPQKFENPLKSKRYAYNKNTLLKTSVHFRISTTYIQFAGSDSYSSWIFNMNPVCKHVATIRKVHEFIHIIGCGYGK